MRPVTATCILASAAMLATACSAAGTAGGSGSTSPAPAPTSASAAASSPAASQSGAATSLDPCQLVTSSEASALAGTSYGPGTEETSGGGKQCVYGSQTMNVFMVILGQAASPAAAQSQWSQEKSKALAAIQQKVPSGMGMSVHTSAVPGLGDRAETANGSLTVGGQKISFSEIYLLKGATFLAFGDLQLGNRAPSTSAMESEARTALGRVP